MRNLAKKFRCRRPVLGLLSVLLTVAAASRVHAEHEPTPGFEKYGLDTSKFHQTRSFSVFDASQGYVRTIHYNYVYKDGRLGKSEYNADVSMDIHEFASPEKARAYLQKRLAGALPEAQASAVKLPPCRGEKRNSDNFVGPIKLFRKYRHPNGTEVVVWHSGDFNMVDCTRGNNKDEYVDWTDGVYYFRMCALPRKSPDVAYGRAEEFALDYLAALGQPVTPLR